MMASSFHNASLICVAVVTAPHGVQGHVKLKCFLEDPSQLKKYSPFSDERGVETFKVNKVLGQVKDTLIIALEGVTDRNKAEELKGEKFMLPRERLPELPKDTFYYSDLIGLPVKSKKGQSLGKVHALYDFGAGDILEIQTTQNKMVMIPFRKDAVPTINFPEGHLILSEQEEVLLREEHDSV